MINVHSVKLRVAPERAGALLDTLGSEADVLWPGDRWPPMRVEGPLRVGAAGRHGPVKYIVQEYVASQRVCFRFTQPHGFDGTHTFEVFPEADGCRLEHRVEMVPRGLARLAWPLVFGPLHDALAEDAVARAVEAFSPLCSIGPEAFSPLCSIGPEAFSPLCSIGPEALGETRAPNTWSAWVRLLRGLGDLLERPRRAGEGSMRAP